MTRSRYTFNEVQENTIRQLYSLESNIYKGQASINDAADIIPGAIMIQNFNLLSVEYMNEWGCEKLGHSMDEVNAMGDSYYKQHFKAEQASVFMGGMMNLYLKKDHTQVYNFFHQVLVEKNKWEWYFGVSKFYRSQDHLNSEHLIVVAHPVTGIENMVKQVIKKLDENDYVIKNYKKFALLTKREKEIIKDLCNGLNNFQIAESHFLSQHTVKTHRKNKMKKLELESFAELIKFSISFDLDKNDFIK